MQISLQQIDEADLRLKEVIVRTPLQLSKRLSQQYGANIYLKREDMQEVRSYKIRGAYNKMASLSSDEKKRGVVCASAGNHAQGVSYSCSLLKIHGVIFMPTTTPNQKIERVKHFGEKFITIKLVGNTYDEASAASKHYCEEKSMVFVHPFNDPLTVAGQGTIGKEIYEQLGNTLDFVIVPIGGGGCIAGITSYLKQKNEKITLYGVEPAGAPAMYEALKQQKLVKLDSIDTFVDGCAVQKVGEIGFEACQTMVKGVLLLPEGKDCTTMIDLYQNEGIIAEPAGALSIAALDYVANEIKGKTVVCILSGGNNDILRYPEIMERSLVSQGRKHYFLIEFAQKPGQLRDFLDKALGKNDDIVRFEYMKNTNKEKGAALVGIELKERKDLEPLLERMKQRGIKFQQLSDKELLYNYLI
jgi:threonine dehydratase